MLTTILVLQAIGILIGVVDLFMDLRSALPRRRRAEQMDDARRAVAAAEQLYRGKDKGQDRARAATQQLLDLHPKMPAARARMLVETAVSEAKHATTKSTASAEVEAVRKVAEPKVDSPAAVKS